MQMSLEDHNHGAEPSYSIGQCLNDMKWQYKTGPEIISFFLCSAQLSMEFDLLINLTLLTIANCVLLNIAEYEIFSAINMKMPAIVDILFIFISRETFSLTIPRRFFCHGLFLL